MYPRSKDYISLIYANFFYLISAVLLRLPPTAACMFWNVFCRLIGSRTRFFWESKKNLFVAKENQRKMYFTNMRRGFDCYTLGVEKRGQTLQDSYLLGKVHFDFDDILIDCGANYGDLFIGLRDKINIKNYYCVEPAPEEFRSLSASWPAAKHRQIGFADKTGEIEFYTASASADSSIVQPAVYDSIIMIQTVTLDDFCVKEGVKKCKLFKLEAEGYEYEILLGAMSFLKICEYVAVDGGAEKGLSADPTLPAVTNLLTGVGFEMVGFNDKQCRALFRNKAHS